MPKLTKTIIDATPTPATGDTWVWCSDLQGFGLRVQASGRKTYVLRYRTKDAARTQRKLTICRCCDAPPDKARGMAREVMTGVAGGADPAAERKPATASTITIEAMFEARIASMRDKNRAMVPQVEAMLLLSGNNAADALGRTRAPADITPSDIVKYVSSFYDRGCPGAADKARSYLAAAFAWAITSANDYTVKNGKDWGVKFNPAAAVAKDPNAKTVRDRNLDAAEIRVLWEACQDGNAGFSLPIESCLKLMIGCGQRVQETLRMDGSEIDLDAMVWKMPANKTKGGKRAHTIPLPRVVAPTLMALKAIHGDGPLFPARTGSKSALINIVSIAQAVRRWIDTEGNTMVAFQPRDLRRTWKSRTHDAGIDRFTRDLIQQHAKGSDTGSKHYDRADYSQQMRVAMDKWSRWLDATIEGRQPLLLAA